MAARFVICLLVVCLAGACSAEQPVGDVACTLGVADPSIIEVTSPGARIPCEHEDSNQCSAEYLGRFLDQTKTWAKPVASCESAIQDIVDQKRRWETSPPPAEMQAMAADELRSRIIAALNLGGLMEGLPERPLTVTTTAVRETATYRELDLLFTDPLVGTFQGLFLTPLGQGPFPVVLQLPGHNEDAAVQRDQRYGKEYPALGIATLILSFRAYDGGLVEDQVSRAMLCAGFTLQTIRQYEAMLALRYLRSRPTVCTDRLGLLGHSGGSVAVNGLARLDPKVKMFVSDWHSEYLEILVEPDGHALMLDDTAPSLVPLRWQINELSTARMPGFDVGYGYCDDCGDGQPRPKKLPERLFTILRTELLGGS